MKKSFFKTFAALMAFGLVFSACSKDDNDEKIGVGSIIYKGVTYSMPRGFIDYYPSTPSAAPYDLSLTLYSEGINYGGIIPKGTGSYIEVAFLSSSSKEITPGIYTINNGVKEGNVLEAFLYLNVNYTEGNATKVTINSGTITVAKSNSQYTITLNGKNFSNESITGTYVGTLEFNTVEEGRK